MKDGGTKSEVRSTKKKKGVNRGKKIELELRKGIGVKKELE